MDNSSVNFHAVEITVVQSAGSPRFHPNDAAQLVEVLRSEYGYYGSWRKAHGLLYFATSIKEHVPNSELEEAAGEE